MSTVDHDEGDEDRRDVYPDRLYLLGLAADDFRPCSNVTDWKSPRYLPDPHTKPIVQKVVKVLLDEYEDARKQ